MGTKDEYLDGLRQYGDQHTEVSAFAMSSRALMHRHPELYQSPSISPENIENVAGVAITSGTIETFGKKIIIDDKIPKNVWHCLTQYQVEKYYPELAEKMKEVA